MPNLILLTGIVIYAYGHIPPLHLPRAHQWRVRVTWLTLIVLGIGLVAQVGVASEFGVTNASRLHDGLKYYDRFFVNLDRYPKQDRSCELGLVAYLLPVSILRIQLAAEDKLGEFQPTLYRYYRSLGPPVALIPECSKAPAAPRPEALGGDRRESRTLVGI